MRLGITGSFGSGKTTVAGMFAGLGAGVIDADKITHALLQDAGVKQRIKNIFGAKVFFGSRIDREKLGETVFKNKRLLDKLCGILHPRVIREIERISRRSKINGRPIIIDAPLLLEAGLGKKMDAVIVVYAPRKAQLRRLREKGYTYSQVCSRIRMQLPLREKLKSADYVIDNGNGLEQTEKQVKKIWGELSYDRC